MHDITRRRLLAASSVALTTPALQHADAATRFPASHLSRGAGLTDIAPPSAGFGTRVAQHDLMRVPPAQHGINWLKASLQAAIELEFSTIPPYLCAVWSIKDADHPVRILIRDVVSQEMLHLGLACNLLTSIGGTPAINAPATVPRYPGGLPGGVRPGLRVALQGLTREAVRDVFMQIEYPEGGPILDTAAGHPTPTIGAFYDAIAAAYQNLPPASIPGKRQLTNSEFKLFAITSKDDALRAIEEIKHQGEGTHQSPEEGSFGAGLAHYYTFAEIYHGRKLAPQADGRWTFSGDALPFPEVYPVAEVPRGGYPQSHAFNVVFTTLLHHLQAAWQYGHQHELDAAVKAMKPLTEHALALMKTPLPNGNGHYGPAFRLVT